ncbi:hypothetical protein EV421DRAFT_1945490 [Armillaria borealis]|uniref:Uncharacterized protein n=1 Tax=Armillaria borealis TaxID=47425 RepID=A0AA39JPH1_9AGAR|nr:hypothetical protein EV421DRAFT_1945490 [Armillaria borealis]
MATPHTPAQSSTDNFTEWTPLLDYSSASLSSPYIPSQVSDYSTPHRPSLPITPYFSEVSPLPMPPTSAPVVLPSTQPFLTDSAMTPSNSNPTVPNQPSSVIVKPLVIDRLAKDFELSDPQRKHLYLFTELASLQGGLSMPDALTRLFSLAVQFNLHNACFEGDQNAETMSSLLDDLKSQLVKGFDFTKVQKDNIRFVVRDIIYDPQRMAYHDIEDEVFRGLLKEKDTLGFKNVFGIPSREHLLHSEIHVISSSVRNRMQEDFHDSLKKNLADFTHDMNKKYRCVFRRFVAENPDLVGAIDKATLDAENNQPNPIQPLSKKRKLASGRSAKGADFWSKIDEFLREKIELYKSSSLLSESWKP